jgi:hypothetical protein
MKNKFAEAQKRLKLSNKDFAEFLGLKGINPSVTIIRWKTCQRIPHPTWMKVITEKTGVTPNDFYEAWYEKHKI